MTNVRSRRDGQPPYTNAEPRNNSFSRTRNMVQEEVILNGADINAGKCACSEAKNASKIIRTDAAHEWTDSHAQDSDYINSVIGSNVFFSFLYSRIQCLLSFLRFNVIKAKTCDVNILIRAWRELIVEVDGIFEYSWKYIARFKDVMRLRLQIPSLIFFQLVLFVVRIAEGGFYLCCMIAPMLLFPFLGTFVALVSPYSSVSCLFVLASSSLDSLFINSPKHSLQQITQRSRNNQTALGHAKNFSFWPRIKGLNQTTSSTAYKAASKAISTVTGVAVSHASAGPRIELWGISFPFSIPAFFFGNENISNGAFVPQFASQTPTGDETATFQSLNILWDRAAAAAGEPGAAMMHGVPSVSGHFAQQFFLLLKSVVLELPLVLGAIQLSNGLTAAGFAFSTPFDHRRMQQQQLTAAAIEFQQQERRRHQQQLVTERSHQEREQRQQQQQQDQEQGFHSSDVGLVSVNEEHVRPHQPTSETPVMMSVNNDLVASGNLHETLRYRVRGGSEAHTEGNVSRNMNIMRSFDRAAEVTNGGANANVEGAGLNFINCVIRRSFRRILGLYSRNNEINVGIRVDAGNEVDKKIDNRNNFSRDAEFHSDSTILSKIFFVMHVLSIWVNKLIGLFLAFSPASLMPSAALRIFLVATGCIVFRVLNEERCTRSTAYPQNSVIEALWIVKHLHQQVMRLPIQQQHAALQDEVQQRAMQFYIQDRVLQCRSLTMMVALTAYILLFVTGFFLFVVYMFNGAPARLLHIIRIRKCTHLDICTADDAKKTHKSYINAKDLDDDENCSKQSGDAESCIFCFEEFLEGQMLRVISHCNHRFHESCLNGWLLDRQKSSCPMCGSLKSPSTERTNTSRGVANRN